MAQYNQIVFEAKNPGRQEVILSLNNSEISNHNDQFEYTFESKADWTTYEIGFEELASANSNLTFDAENLNLIEFTILGDNLLDKLFEFEVRNVKFNSDFQSSVSIEESTLNQIAIYPNPAKDNIFIKLDNNVLGTYTLIDITGKTIANGSLNENINTINVSNFAKGSYILKVNTITETMVSRVIIE